MTDAPEQVAAYAAALERFVARGREQELEAAYAIGRRAVADGMTILGLIDQHRAAIEVLAGRGVELKAEQLDATFQFLSEALATFEMAQRGYWEAKEMAARERAIALMLQHDLLPAAVPPLPGMDVAVRYQPGEATSHAGGDWYDIFPHDGGRVGLVVGDVTGHGVAAAATMGQLRIAVLAYALGGHEPREVVGDLDVLVERLGTGDIATMVYVTVDRTHHQLVVTSAGHPPPVIVAPDGTCRMVDGGHGRLLGVSPPPVGRTQVDVPVAPGSHVLMYTDGLVEPAERAGIDGLELLARATRGFQGSADELCDHVLAELAPAGARDDICILAATVLG